MDWHGGGATAEDSDKVILEGLNGFYGHIASVFLGGYEFIGHAKGFDGGLVLH
jgi:hypothetical protein